jgi:hypothetical protein
MHLHFPSIASAERPATNRSHQLATRLSPPAEERLIDAGSTLSKSTGQMIFSMFLKYKPEVWI